jgi:predicted NACHT family NTPase
LATDSKRIAKANSASIFEQSRFAIITGTGGCGKSVLMRHLFIDVINGKEKVPILIELRELNRSGIDLNSLIAKALELGGFELDQEAVALALKLGVFALLFDGFDELEDALRNKVASEIRDFTKANSNLWILVTSRPDDEFNGWNGFVIFKAQPLTLAQAIELVRLAPVDKILVERFITDLKTSLYRKHESFLSNPLLLSIMLVTYCDSADIPSKLSVFYSHAYISLFQRHDAWKGGFKRERKCDLDIDGFSRLFSAFAMLSYNERLFSFDKVTAIKIIKQACELSGLKVNAESFLLDATQAVCLLVEDGLLYAYSHRSFQEYFTAKFIAQAPSPLKTSLLLRFSEWSSRDNVLRLLHEMQPEFVEFELVLPKLSAFLKKIGLKKLPLTKPQYLEFLRTFLKAITFEKNGQVDYDVKHNEMNGLNILSFAIWGCGLSPLGDQNRDLLVECVKKCLRGESGKRILLSKALPSNPLINCVFNCNVLIGGVGCVKMFEIVELLKEKRSRYSQPLAEVLAIK